MKQVIVGLFIFFIGTTLQAQDTTAIAAKVKIIPAKDGATEKATAAIMAAFAGKPSTGFFKFFFIVGPKLWAAIKDKAPFTAINPNSGNVTFKVPDIKPDGSWKETINVTAKALQSEEDFTAFWQYLLQTYKGSSAKLVEKNAVDIFIYWQCFAKIDEPVVSVATDNARFVISVTGEGSNLFFIELTGTNF